MSRIGQTNKISCGIVLLFLVAILSGCSDPAANSQSDWFDSGVSTSMNDSDADLNEGTARTNPPPPEVPNDGKANLTLAITDAPIDDAVSVDITFKRIEIKEGTCGVPMQTCDSSGDASGEHCGYTEYFQAADESEEVTVDLLTYRNGESFFFDTQSLAVGEYCQIRIYLSEVAAKNTITLADESDPIQLNIVPGIRNNGLKLVSGFTIEDGVETRLTIDFDVRKSIVVKRGSKKPRYYLKPTVRLVQTNLTGNITVTKDVIAVDEVLYLYIQDFDVTDEPYTQIVNDQGTDVTSDDVLEDMPFANAVSSTVSFETDGVLKAVFSYIPFGTYDIYKLDNSSDSLNLVQEDVVLFP